jgi:hypothetical protein
MMIDHSPPKRLARRAWLAAALLVLLASVGSGAWGSGTRAEEPFDAATRAALQNVVGQQLQAFARDDAPAAESFAAPAIRERFPDPAAFMEMVRSRYAALIRPKATQFAGVLPSPHGPLQKMTVVAADGTVWSAIYSFEQVGDQWRITGCGLQQDGSQQDI